MCVPTYAPRRWTQTADIVAAPTQCAVPVMGQTRIREIKCDTSLPTHDPAVATSAPLAAFINDDAVRATHDAFQDLCERNTRQIVGLPEGASVAGTPMPAIEKSTCFHSQQVPGLSLHDLGAAMHRNSRCGAAAQLVAVVLMARYCDGTNTVPTANMMHRLYVACLHVGIKAHCDQYYRVDHFAYFAGIDTRELLRQELEVLRGAQWQVQVSARQLHHTVDVITAKRLARSPPALGWFTESVESFGRTATPAAQRMERSASTESSLDGRDWHAHSNTRPSSATTNTTTLPPAPALPGRGSSLDNSIVTSSASSGPSSSDEGTPCQRASNATPRRLTRGHRCVKASKVPQCHENTP